MDARENLFRREIVERLAAPDELDELLGLEPWRGWPLAAALLLLFGALFAWSFIPSVSVHVEGIGILLPLPGTVETAPAGDARPNPRAQIFVAAESAALLRPGQMATLRPLDLAGYPAEAIAARVLTVAATTLDRDELQDKLSDPALAERIAAEGLLWPIELEAIDPLQALDSAWSKAEIQVRGRVYTQPQRPIDGLLPWRRDSLAGDPR